MDEIKNEKITKIENYHFDERFYCKENEDGSRIYQPSVTYILGVAYPSGYGLEHWRGDVGNKRADEILEQSGEDGTFVHSAIEGILKGESVASTLINERFNPRRSLKIHRCLKAFLDWHAEFNPEVLKTESVVWSDEHGFAGTLDLICRIKNKKGEEKTVLVDFKTSKSIQASHKAQIVAYGLCETVDAVAILQLGNTTAKKYSFLVLKPDERDNYIHQFISANQLFKSIYPDAKPSEEKFPEIFALTNQTQGETPCTER